MDMVKCSKCGRPTEGVKFMADMGVPTSCKKCLLKSMRKIAKRKKAHNTQLTTHNS